MNNISLWLDYVLPGVAVAASGLFAIALTGGEEEYPAKDMELTYQDRDKPGGVADAANDDQPEVERLAAAEEKINFVIEYLDKQSTYLEETPKWAEALLVSAKNIEDALGSIKSSKVSCKQCGMGLTADDVASTHDDTTTNNDPQSVSRPPQKSTSEWRQELWQQIAKVMLKYDLSDLDQAIDEKDTDETTAPSVPVSAEVEVACDLLIMYVGNVLRSPTVPRYRKISTQNSSFRTNLLKIEHHEALLHAVGFERPNGDKATHYEWQWWQQPANPNSEETRASSGSSNTTSTETPDNETAKLVLQDCIDLLNACKQGRERFGIVLLAKRQSLLGDFTSTAEATAETNGDSISSENRGSIADASVGTGNASDSHACSSDAVAHKPVRQDVATDAALSFSEILAKAKTSAGNST